jgi:hypothetical protein
MKDIIKIATEIREQMEHKAYMENLPSDLGGLCAIASAELHTALKQNGIDTTFNVASDGDCDFHVFLTKDNKIIDITATQFHKKYKKVYIEELEKANYDYWKPSKQFSSRKDLVKYQKERKWPKSQIPKV